MNEITRLSSGGMWEDVVGYSRVVVAGGPGGRTAWTAGCTATLAGRVIHVGDALQQARVAMATALFALERAGFGVECVVQTRMYVKDLIENQEAVGLAHSEVFGAVRPAATMIGVADLVDPDMLVEVEVVAWSAGDSPAA
jgi:enamine deaminase RidA (YjgF/YER057c/UK114 family)